MIAREQWIHSQWNLCGKIHNTYSQFSAKKINQIYKCIFSEVYVNNVRWIFGMIIWPLDSSDSHRSDMSWATSTWSRTMFVHNSTLTNVCCVMYTYTYATWTQELRECQLCHWNGSILLQSEVVIRLSKINNEDSLDHIVFLSCTWVTFQQIGFTASNIYKLILVSNSISLSLLPLALPVFV